MLPSHKEGVLYLEHCRLVVADERLAFVRGDDAGYKYWSIPYAATGCILLGPGTSLTQQAAKFLASEGVTVGFVGGGGVPLFFASQSEYRPTQYLQAWCSFWFNASARLRVARFFLQRRAEFVGQCYRQLRVEDMAIASATNDLLAASNAAGSTEELLGAEAVFAKRLYAFWARSAQLRFTRQPRQPDLPNRFLDQGNYLAYGLAGFVLWVLGIPHAMPVLHGNTRRGALVFDLADVIKDACILPSAFLGVADNDNESANRLRCVAALDRFRALPTLFQAMKDAIDVGCGDC